MRKTGSKPYRSNGASSLRGDYEYFQLYDPDDSDLEDDDEVDPDVQSLLSRHAASLGLGGTSSSSSLGEGKGCWRRGCCCGCTPSLRWIGRGGGIVLRVS